MLFISPLTICPENYEEKPRLAFFVLQFLSITHPFQLFIIMLESENPHSYSACQDRYVKSYRAHLK